MTAVCDVMSVASHEHQLESRIAETGRAGSHFVPMILQCPPKKKGPKVEEVKNFGSIHTLRSLPDQGGDVYKVWFRSVQKCEFV